MSIEINNIYNGDCLELMKSIDEKSIDFILCDLPYGTTNNKWDKMIDFKKLWEEYKRIIKKEGVICLTSQGLFTAKIILSNENMFKYKLIWVKSKPTNFLNSKIQPLRQHEDVCVFYEKGSYTPLLWKSTPYNKGKRKEQQTGSYNDFESTVVKSEKGLRYPTDVFYCNTAESDFDNEIIHPTQKPISLGRYLIKLYSKENDIVLDNCFGSGSFIASAIIENRNYIGIEKNKKYFEKAQKRIQKILKLKDDNYEFPPIEKYLKQNLLQK